MISGVGIIVTSKKELRYFSVLHILEQFVYHWDHLVFEGFCNFLMKIYDMKGLRKVKNKGTDKGIPDK